MYLVGCDDHTKERNKQFAKLLVEGAEKEDIDDLIMGIKEAEVVKFFANTYLTWYVSYFNELDTYAEMRKVDTVDIIKCVGLDTRIGDFYNTPSFGYGGWLVSPQGHEVAVG